MVNFREFITSSGLKIFGGRDAENNDDLVWSAKPNDVLLHTSAPGSPFVNVGDSAAKKDIKEAAVFCAKYSQDWRDSKRDVVVNIFLKKDTSKGRKMKAGSWSVRKQERVKVKKSDILKFEEVLRREEVA
jgi:predicted ribosome quality control (RQC) complex YloA/Tae2 family protein